MHILSTPGVVELSVSIQQVAVLYDRIIMPLKALIRRVQHLKAC